MSVEHRVVGPPGCGKTTYLTRQCNVAAEKYGGGGVAVASLTRTAAREVAGRETKVPVQNIGTLHAHAYRKLGHPALALDREGVKDWNAKCGNPAWKLSAKQIAGSPENDAPMEMAMVDDGGDELLAEVQVLRAKMVDERLWSHRVLSFWKAWEDWKAQAGRLDFTDLVEEAIAKVPNLEVSVVMLDEAQDMSALEMTLARQWGEEAEQFVVVGDPDQNLFSWRGSDPEAFYAVEAQTTRVLSQSYRVPKAVHEAAVRWIERIPGRVPVEYEPTEREGKVVRHEMVGLDDAERVVRMIDGMRQDGSSVMLLASCGYMLNPVLAALRTAAIPFHNPYRVTNGAWNPMRGGERLLALMRPRAEVWGDEARLWTWDEVWKWVQPMRVEGVLKRGAKQLIQGKVKARGRFDEPEIVDLHTLLELFHEEHREAVFSMDVAWWQSHLLHAHTKPQKYPRDMALLHGGAILRERPKVIVGTIHCSPGDEPILTKRGPIPISQLCEEDRLVGYHRPTNTILGLGSHTNSRGYTFERSERHYEGPLIEIRTGTTRTRVTPNHRVLVRLDEEAFMGRWLVYLMRRGNWWRIGMCASGHRPYRSGGIGGRLATEQGDAAWILGVFDDRVDAIMGEARIQGKYGMTGLTFRSAKDRVLGNSALAAMHDELSPLMAVRAETILEDLGLSADWPLYTRGGDRRNLSGWFTTEAANLSILSGRFCMATFGGRRDPIPARATVSTCPYSGMVYGLEVPPLHHYISGGCVVHNSVKGGEADKVILAPDLSRSGEEQWMSPDKQGPAFRMFYVGMTRAREELHLLGPSQPGFVSL